MSRGQLTTTSYSLLGLLAVQPWSTYELTQQMERSLGHIWPRAQSKLYEEPKKLVAHGLARSTKERDGGRKRTVYSITADGRRALAEWLEVPGTGPTLEFEQLLKVFFADAGTKDGALTNIAAARRWAKERSAESWRIGQQYEDGDGPFPQRRAMQLLTAGFLNDFYALVSQWSDWAEEIVAAWPENPAAAEPDPAGIERTIATARKTAGDALAEDP